MLTKSRNRNAKKAARPKRQLKLSPELQANLRAHLKSPEGQVAMDRLGDLIVESFVSHMTEDERRAFSTPEGQKAFINLWPEIVDAFLHPAAAKLKKRTTK